MGATVTLYDFDRQVFGKDRPPRCALCEGRIGQRLRGRKARIQIDGLGDVCLPCAEHVAPSFVQAMRVMRRAR